MKKIYFQWYLPRVLLCFLLLCPFFVKPSEHIKGTETFVIKDGDYVIRQYTMDNTTVSQPLKIALITDFHDRDTSNIAAEIAKYKPDLILLAGDIFERVEETQIAPVIHPFVKRWRKFIAMSKKSYNIENSRKLIVQLGKIAPVYISRGNHEVYYLPKDIMTIVESNGTLLDNTDVCVTVKGIKIQVGGLSTQYDQEWIKKFSRKKGMKILLCHRPEYYTEYIKGKGTDKFDLIVSGHAHGGQWRFFDKGLYAPGQGVLPKITRGIYGKQIVSTGISNSICVPRICNEKELVFININSKDKTKQQKIIKIDNDDEEKE